MDAPRGVAMVRIEFLEQSRAVLSSPTQSWFRPRTVKVSLSCPARAFFGLKPKPAPIPVLTLEELLREREESSYHQRPMEKSIYA